MGKKKIVIDTNNFISAVGWEGNSRELLLQVNADFLITGDMHLRKLKIFNHTQIVTVQEFLKQNLKN